MLSAKFMLQVDTTSELTRYLKEFKDSSVGMFKQPKYKPDANRIYGFDSNPQQQPPDNTHNATVTKQKPVFKSLSQNNLNGLTTGSGAIQPIPFNDQMPTFLRHHTTDIGQTNTPDKAMRTFSQGVEPFNFLKQPFAKYPNSFIDEDYYIGTEVQSNKDKYQEESECMTGVTGLLSLSVRLGDVCNLSAMVREQQNDSYLENQQKIKDNQGKSSISQDLKDIVVKVQSPTVRVLSGSCQSPQKKLLLEVGRGLKAQQEVVAALDGLGGTYFFKNERGENVAIVKPIDEEPLAPNNPKGYVGRQLGDPGWKSSIRVGEAAVRELVAYLLDYDNKANVPTTLLAKIKHPIFNNNDPQVKGPLQKIVSVQKFVTSEGDCSDVGCSQFKKVDVQRIALLDIRIFNTDRHSGNLLYKKSQGNNQSSNIRQAIISGEYNYQLTPIDHGFCLPESLECPYFEWLYWPQVAMPIDPELKDMVMRMDIEKDIEILRTQIPQQILRRGIIRMYYFSATFLKICVMEGLNIYEMGRLMSEAVSNDPEHENYNDDQDMETTELMKIANLAISQMDNYEDQVSSVESYGGHDLDLGKVNVGSRQALGAGNSGKSVKSQGSRTCKNTKTFTLPEDKQVDPGDIEFEMEDTPREFEVSRGIQPFAHTYENEVQNQEGTQQNKGFRRNSYSLSELYQELSYSELGGSIGAVETPINYQSIQQSPFYNRTENMQFQNKDSLSTSPDKSLDQDYQQQAQSLACYEPYFFDQAMRVRTNPINNKLLTQPQKINGNKQFFRYKHLYSNYVKGNKQAQGTLESICFDNFTDHEFSLFIESFRDILINNLRKNLYRDPDGVDTSRYALSVPY